jgi:xanthine dehydrogenase YagS FAD-binding subunit
VAAVVELADGALKDVRIALGGVAHVPWRAERAEEVLRDAEPGPEAFAEAADAELSAADPLRDNAFKVPLARNVLIRTLSELTA